MQDYSRDDRQSKRAQALLENPRALLQYPQSWYSIVVQDYPRDDQENQRAQALLKNRTEDAVKIYRK